MSNDTQRIEELSKRVADLETFVGDLLGFTTRRLDSLALHQSEDYYDGMLLAYDVVRARLTQFTNPSSNPTT